MVKLRKLLLDSAKVKRHRRNILTIHITVLAWMLEFIGFFIIILGTFILGHENNIVNFSLQTLTTSIYFIGLPCVFLINNTNFKRQVADSNWYNTFLMIFDLQYKHSSTDNNEESIALSNHVVDEERNGNRDVLNSDNVEDKLSLRSIEDD